MKSSKPLLAVFFVGVSLCYVTPTTLRAGNLILEAVALLEAADVVLIVDSETTASGDTCCNVGEIWKADKPLRLRELGISALAAPKQSILVVFDLPPQSDLNQQVKMRVRPIPICDGTVTLSFKDGPHRLSLFELRLAWELQRHAHR